MEIISSDITSVTLLSLAARGICYTNVSSFYFCHCLIYGVLFVNIVIDVHTSLNERSGSI